LQSQFGSSLQASGEEGRRSSFEITVLLQSGDKKTEPVLLWSKLKEGKFPAIPSVIQAIQAYAQNGTATAVEAEKKTGLFGLW